MIDSSVSLTNWLTANFEWFELVKWFVVDDFPTDSYSFHSLGTSPKIYQSAVWNVNFSQFFTTREQLEIEKNVHISLIAFSFLHDLVPHLSSLRWAYRSSLNRARDQEHLNKSVKRFPAKMETFLSVLLNFIYNSCFLSSSRCCMDEIFHGKWFGNNFYFFDFFSVSQFASSRGFIFRLAPLLDGDWAENNNREKKTNEKFFPLTLGRKEERLCWVLGQELERWRRWCSGRKTGLFENCVLHCYLSYSYSRA